MYKRILTLPMGKTEACFLWGPKQTAKSTLFTIEYIPGQVVGGQDFSAVMNQILSVHSLEPDLVSVREYGKNDANSRLPIPGRDRWR